MLPELQNSKIFKKEIKEYNTAIDKIQNDKIKKEYETLLSKLIAESKIIDQLHNPLASGNIDPRKVRENIENMGLIRLKLRKLVKNSKYC